MTLIKRIWCVITHRGHWTWYGHGDWRIQLCEKCGDKWVVPSYEVKGQRKEPSHDH